MNIKIITFKNLISIICHVLEETSDGLIVNNPAEIIPNIGKDDPLRVTFAPFLHYAKESITGLFLSEKDILCVCTPVDGMYNHYKNLFEKAKSENMDE